MEKSPQFRVTKRTKYGPHLERIDPLPWSNQGSEDGTESFEYPEDGYKLNEKQRADLRKVLALVAGLSVFSAMKGIENNDSGTEVPPDTISYTETHQSTAKVAPKMVNKPTRDLGSEVASAEEAEEAKETEFGLVIKEYENQLKDPDIAETIAYATKPVRGHEEFTRAEYAKTALEFRSKPDERTGKPPLPIRLQENLREAAVGWVAQESRFKGDLISKNGATGIWQFLPRIYRHYSGKDKVSLSMEEQTKLAGELISDNYHYILHFAGREALDKLRRRYNSEEEFIDDFMTPVMINAFNAGGPLMGKILRKFAETVSEEEMESGKDLFLQVADFAKANFENYREEQYEYVPRVYAMGKVLKEKLGDRRG